MSTDAQTATLHLERLKYTLLGPVDLPTLSLVEYPQDGQGSPAYYFLERRRLLRPDNFIASIDSFYHLDWPVTESELHVALLRSHGMQVACEKA